MVDKEAHGGILGDAPRGITITNCYNTGNIVMNPPTNLTNPGDVGGIIGSAHGSEIIQNCYNLGNITATRLSSVGGIGGIIRDDYGSQIKNCYNLGVIEGKTHVGGILGYSKISEIKNCYNAGNIISSQCMGGIIGYNDFSNASITNSYNYVYIERDSQSSSTAKGAIVGYCNGSTISKTSISNCGYYSPENVSQIPYGYAKYINISNNSYYDDISKMTSAIISELSDAFVEDTEGINNGYPILAWQVESAE